MLFSDFLDNGAGDAVNVAEDADIRDSRIGEVSDHPAFAINILLAETKIDDPHFIIKLIVR